ncbi:hypothetical protein AVO45_05660 [Ruegeria marisrubri]|uniref:DUF2147 domain-containing protein n=1 Tax=Ruegeria marisrubri TaxID=1685379 RepID=A0A0X3TXR0_9RHOB|nr:hypothetical protein [Ruegeria marisrubri]KUJ80533.1 hypothetical protein AVO45_05660 [Ruegeria marisrubri]
MANLLKTMATAGALWSSTLWADPLAGTKTVWLVDGEGRRTEIATVTFSPGGEETGYAIDWNEDVFSDHFLSMRPFKCLEGPDKHWCHVPYPYDIRRQVSPDDLTDLEYDFLFLWKGASEYGINMWNGVYYRLEASGDRLTGRLHELDMDLLSAPPAPGTLRPLSEGDLHEADPDSHWLPRLLIE